MIGTDTLVEMASFRSPDLPANARVLSFRTDSLLFSILPASPFISMMPDSGEFFPMI